MNEGRECQFLSKLEHGGPHFHIRRGEELEGPPKKRPLWGGSLEGVGGLTVRCELPLWCVRP